MSHLEELQKYIGVINAYYVFASFEAKVIQFWVKKPIFYNDFVF